MIFMKESDGSQEQGEEEVQDARTESNDYYRNRFDIIWHRKKFCYADAVTHSVEDERRFIDSTPIPNTRLNISKKIKK